LRLFGANRLTPVMEHYVESILHLVQILFWVASTVAVFAVLKRLAGGASPSKRAKKLGFLHVHPNTEFTRRGSIAQRKSAGDTAGDTDGDELGRGNRFAVMRFNGDVRATGKEGFALLVDEVLANKEKFKAAIVVVNSPGGGVAEYGQMYAEMLRLRKADVDLTICVDTMPRQAVMS
jgi:ClpP class serine protease